MEQSLREKIKLLGKLLDRKEKIDLEVARLYSEVGYLMSGTTKAQTTPGDVGSPQVDGPAAPNGNPVSEGREKQGRYMAAVRGLSAPERILVKQARDKHGVDYAIDYAKGLKDGTYGKKPEDESQDVAAASDEFPPVGETLDTADTI